MEFYRRFPDRALAGMSELNPGQRGIYNSVIDLLYARDGLVPCLTPADDAKIARNISVDIRTWKTFKRQLMTLGKIRITANGCLDANGVERGRFEAETHSEIQAKRARNRWEKYRLSKQINGSGNAIAGTATYKNKNKYSSTSSNAGAEPAAAAATTPRSSSDLTTTAALEMSLRKKGWI